MYTDCSTRQCEADGELDQHSEDQIWSTVHQSILSIAHTDGKQKASQQLSNLARPFDDPLRASNEI
jgi:hypothetical protein